MILDDLTVIIPIGTDEVAWRPLLDDLKSLPPAAEILLVGINPEPGDFQRAVVPKLPCATRWLQSTPGRAKQLNCGAANASRTFLWFLHADSRVDRLALERLDFALRERPLAIHFFELVFQPDGPRITRLNSWAANLRSRWLRLPFGDQGFCASKKVFQALGQFDESVPYGEDHLFIWKAHRKRIQVKSVQAQISTSARKYQCDGWLRTTCVHLSRTGRQALPEFVRLLVSKWGL
jgi:hypothetical protein